MLRIPRALRVAFMFVFLTAFAQATPAFATHTAGVAAELANGERECADCHLMELGPEHAKSTSSVASRTCTACHDVRDHTGIADQLLGHWDLTCYTPVCHGQETTRAMHTSYCLGCHDPSADATFTVVKVDFAAPAVDREAACVKCHWEPAGSHPYHNVGWNCGSCHTGMGFFNAAAAPAVPTAYGWFNSALSAEADADTLHVIHSNPTWAGSLTKSGRRCDSCHAAAACTVCHATAGIDPTHWDHTWDATLSAYWPGTGPSGTLFGRGTNVGNESERTLTSGITCSDATCHNPPSGAGASVLVEDIGSPVVYTGAGWARVNQSGFSGNSYSRSNAAGARAELVFEGEKVEFISGKHPYFGKVRVYLDSVEVTTADLYSPSVVKQSVAYRSPTLASGTHTITVEVIREKNAAARDYYGLVDAFRVYPSVSLTKAACSACHAPDTFTGAAVDRRADH